MLLLSIIWKNIKMKDYQKNLCAAALFIRAAFQAYLSTPLHFSDFTDSSAKRI